MLHLKRIGQQEVCLFGFREKIAVNCTLLMKYTENLHMVISSDVTENELF